MTQPAIPGSWAFHKAPRIVVIVLALVSLQAPSEQQAGPQKIVMPVAGGTIEITLPGEPMEVSSKDLLDWVKAKSAAVSQYYGHFPVAHLTLRIRADASSAIHHGVTYPKDGGMILIAVGHGATVAGLTDDWVLTHEMIHLAFPSMAENHHWIEEGLSTYIEPIARAQAGQMPVAEVWKQFLRDMPKGQPAPGDEGLDQTPTWGRTYWGGAMFCLLADVEIRERTHNRKGLQDALRAILDHGGIITKDWEIKKTLAVGDKATGTRVLLELYEKMRDKPAPADLGQLWENLGLELKDGKVTFNDKAVDAAIRKAITSPRP